MRPVPIVLVATLLVAGCAARTARDPASAPAASTAAATPAATGAPANLDGSEWRFVEVAGAAVPAGVTAALRLHDGRASGKAGCNAYGAAYHVAADGSAGFQQALSTKMACLRPAGAMATERGIFTAFRDTAKVEVRGGELVLFDAAGKPLAKLARADSSAH